MPCLSPCLFQGHEVLHWVPYKKPSYGETEDRSKSETWALKQMTGSPKGNIYFIWAAEFTKLDLVCPSMSVPTRDLVEYSLLGGAVIRGKSRSYIFFAHLYVELVDSSVHYTRRCENGKCNHWPKNQFHLMRLKDTSSCEPFPLSLQVMLRVWRKQGFRTRQTWLHTRGHHVSPAQPLETQLTLLSSLCWDSAYIK